MSLNIDIAKKFRKAFETRCFTLIVDAYKVAIDNKSIKLDWDENDVTAELHSYIDSNQKRIDWKIITNVEQHIPKKNIEKEKGFAAKFPRIDMRLTTFSSDQEYKYHLEAKNLKQNSSKLKRRYIDTGIDNFVSKKYLNGSIIGYLLEGEVQKTIGGINSLLTKDNREDEFLNSKVLTLHPDYYESEHPGIEILKHIVFDFTKTGT
ncbi:hypothetical protein [Tenacibaculum discolor]|uniref:hypothetical protein n=1 Tax=Tenacibaculum discolor TaxID=361581 RepID=UPI000EB0EFFF|nr:hypothetical protein [Tenacibaculum discolor]RLK06701.1 hypothetical protein C8N27_0261 [Tenacibaculum discolor]